MNGPSLAITNEFAKTFARKGKGKGMTKVEILSYFRRYSNNVVDPEFYGLSLTKEKMFHHCLERLHVEDQYRALIDLCCTPPDSENVLPTENQRNELLERLHACGEPNGLTLYAIELDPWEVHREWLKVIGRTEKSPNAAITSARSLLERACKEVLRITEADHADLREGNVAKLVRHAKRALELKEGPDDILKGIGSIVNGLGEVSNRAGDRHGVGQTSSISLAEARLISNMCLSLSVFLLDELRFQAVSKEE